MYTVLYKSLLCLIAKATTLKINYIISQLKVQMLYNIIKNYLCIPNAFLKIALKNGKNIHIKQNISTTILRKPITADLNHQHE